MPDATLRPVIIFHDITHARAIAALRAETGVEVDAASAPGAPLYLGPELLKAIADTAGLSNIVADCGDDSATVQLALRAGLKHLLLKGSHPAFRQLQSLAEAHGARLQSAQEFYTPGRAVLDLLRVPDPLSKCRNFVNGFRPE